jgi:hypothetical protein
MQVRVAETRACDLHEHLARSRLWNGDVAELRLRLPADELNRAH